MRDTKDDGASPESESQPKDGITSNISESKRDFKGAKSGSGAKASSSHRPAWAMTEDAAEAAFDDKAQREEDELLEFTEDLDFDKYIGDLEVQTMMDRLKRRVIELEKEVALEDYRAAEGEERTAKKERLAKMVKKTISCNSMLLLHFFC
jgi:hypothetical protein